MECRDSLGRFNVSVFNILTCSLCYTYLFPKTDFKSVEDITAEPGLTGHDKVYFPDVNNLQTLNPMCTLLGSDDCGRWMDCCRAAVRCCEKQNQNKTRANRNNVCPSTWDGWTCFDDAEGGTTVTTTCPSFIKYGSLEGYVKKYCTKNGTWEKHPIHDREWTDYSNCVNIESFYGVVYAGVISSLISIGLLVPSCLLFVAFRSIAHGYLLKDIIGINSSTNIHRLEINVWQLRSQQRIQLHICLFLSFVVTCILTILWDLLVYDDRIHHPWQQTFMVKYESSCRTIYILLRYARSTNYFWMSCEGIYLYRLLAQAFTFPKSIKVYFYIGWCLPLMPVAIYSAVRLMYADDTCWIRNAGGYEWILYTPNLLCILINFVFLLCILRILLTQLHQHPNEPSNYRRALKATFVLIPLFGLQLFLVIYRPIGQGVQGLYEVISTVIIDSQGGIIAVVLCYCNGEVHACLKTAISRFTVLKPTYASYATTYSVDQSRGRLEQGSKHKKHSINYVPMTSIRNKLSNGDV